jgi:Subtilase family/FG-GAP-like repeat
MKRWLPILAPLLLLTLLVDGFAIAQTLKDGPMAKLRESLVALHQQFTTHMAQSRALPFRSNDPLVRIVEDRVVVDAVASGDAIVLKTELEALGMQHAVAFGRIVSGQLPILALSAAARLASLRFAQPAAAMISPGRVTSEGDQATRSNVARIRFGVNGSGIAVGVLSDSFNCLGGAAADVANGDLSPVAVLQEETDCSSGPDEGRAMLQIVHDLAPGASLLFATADNGIASFAQNIQTLAALGAKVIVDDVKYFAEPMFQDGIIAQAVDNVVATGVAYFSSAGNEARDAYSSTFRPGIGLSPGAFPSARGTPFFFGGTAHNFDPGPGTDVFQRITLPNGEGFIMSLQWDSPAASVSPGAPGSPNDLDVYVFNAAGTQVVAGSVLHNINGDPIEVFFFVNNTGVTADFNIMITNFEGANPGFIKYVLFGFGGTIQEFTTSSGTIYGHANANGAEAVGAAAYFQTPGFGVSPPVLEFYSSSGTTPVLFDLAGNRLLTPDPRADKPEIVAPDGVDTTFFGSFDIDRNGFPNFFGTSAAAPHAAAVAALLLQARPTLTPFKLYRSLENTATDMGSPGFDNNSGFGLIQADAALEALLSQLIADFDGDGISDITVYRDGLWFILRSSDGGQTTVGWGGLPQDIPVPADYDGDGKVDIAVYRDGIWYIIRSSDGGVTSTGWGGLAQDIVVPGDYDGDGKADVAVYRNGLWFILRSSDGGQTTVGWGGLSQDIPVPADYDGDGRVDIAVYRDGNWFIIRSSDGGITAIGWGGLSQDIVVPGDYDGDGKADIAVYRNGTWFILRSSDGGQTTVGWGGLAQDIPVPADYDGDGKTDIAIYRNGLWFIVRSSDGVQTVVGWGGLPQDIPL